MPIRRDLARGDVQGCHLGRSEMLWCTDGLAQCFSVFLPLSTSTGVETRYSGDSHLGMGGESQNLVTRMSARIRVPSAPSLPFVSVPLRLTRLPESSLTAEVSSTPSGGRPACHLVKGIPEQ